MSDSHPPFTFAGWLKSQMALLPMVFLAGTVAFIMSDNHNDERYVKKTQGDEVQAKVDAVASDVQDIKVKQAVSAEQMRAIGGKVDDVKASQEQISDKIDRLLIEKR